MRFHGLYAVCLAAGFAVLAPVPASAQLGDILKAPKTLVDRAIEARSAEDIAEDNRIVIDVNAIMADLGTIKASTEIYEQRLLITGIFDDKSVYDRFEARVREVEGVRELLWHAVYMSNEEQERRKAEMLGWEDVLVLETRVDVELVGTRGVADVNFRTAADSFGTVYMLGRARSDEELAKAERAVRSTEGVRGVRNYAVVRP